MTPVAWKENLTRDMTGVLVQYILSACCAPWASCIPSLSLRLIICKTRGVRAHPVLGSCLEPLQDSVLTPKSLFSFPHQLCLPMP